MGVRNPTLTSHSRRPHGNARLKLSLTLIETTTLASGLPLSLRRHAEKQVAISTGAQLASERRNNIRMLSRAAATPLTTCALWQMGLLKILANCA